MDHLLFGKKREAVASWLGIPEPTTEAMTMVVAADRVVVPNLDEYRGQWVAIKGSDVIAAADDPAEVLRQVEERGVTGWVLDRVPENPDTIFVL